MFSGIVDSSQPVLQVVPRDQVLELHIQRPDSYDDLSAGDSIAIDGVCLTVESFDSHKIVFATAAETLHVTRWTQESLHGRYVNLERSMRWGDRVHGHLVSGHVDALGKITEASPMGESLGLKIKFPEGLAPYLWNKGSAAINGVSLTINRVEDLSISVCVIPETLKRTNLSELKVGSVVNLEVDMMARGLVHNMSKYRAEYGPGASV